MNAEFEGLNGFTVLNVETGFIRSSSLFKRSNNLFLPQFLFVKCILSDKIAAHQIIVNRLKRSIN